MSKLLSPAIFPRTRDRVKQLADVLRVCETPQIKTHIMQKANLTSVDADARILHLVNSRWLCVVEQDGKIAYLRTEEGTEFLRKFAELEELTSREVFG